MCAFYEVFQCVYEGAFYGVFTRLSTEFVGMMGRFYTGCLQGGKDLRKRKVVAWNG